MQDHPEEEICFTTYAPSLAFSYFDKQGDRCRRGHGAPASSTFLDACCIAFGKALEENTGDSQSSVNEATRQGAARAWNGREWPVILAKSALDFAFMGWERESPWHCPVMLEEAGADVAAQAYCCPSHAPPAPPPDSAGWGCSGQGARGDEEGQRRAAAQGLAPGMRATCR
jgi:hypothetical protein